MYRIFLIHSSTEGCLGWFCVLAIVNSAARMELSTTAVEHGLQAVERDHGGGGLLQLEEWSLVVVGRGTSVPRRHSSRVRSAGWMLGVREGLCATRRL